MTTELNMKFISLPRLKKNSKVIISIFAGRAADAGKDPIPEIKKSIIGEKGKLLTENLNVSISFFNDSPISVELPNQIKCKIENTDVALKGQTVSSSYKPAVLVNGLNIQVPPFIEAGDSIVIDTRNLEYIKKI